MLKDDFRAAKVGEKDEEYEDIKYMNAISKQKLKEETRLREECDRIVGEIHWKSLKQIKSLRDKMIA